MSEITELIDETAQLINRRNRRPFTHRQSAFNALTKETKDIKLFLILTVPVFGSADGDQYFIDHESHLWRKKHTGRYVVTELDPNEAEGSTKTQDIDIVNLNSAGLVPNTPAVKLRRALKKQQKTLKQRYPQQYREWLKDQRAQGRHPSVWRVILYGAQGRPSN